jgi:hypothetical protein
VERGQFVCVLVFVVVNIGVSVAFEAAAIGTCTTGA